MLLTSETRLEPAEIAPRLALVRLPTWASGPLTAMRKPTMTNVRHLTRR
jgi:hypothetical protein